MYDKSIILPNYSVIFSAPSYSVKYIVIGNDIQLGKANRFCAKRYIVT